MPKRRSFRSLGEASIGYLASHVAVGSYGFAPLAAVSRTMTGVIPVASARASVMCSGVMIVRVGMCSALRAFMLRGTLAIRIFCHSVAFSTTIFSPKQLEIRGIRASRACPASWGILQCRSSWGAVL